MDLAEIPSISIQWLQPSGTAPGMAGPPLHLDVDPEAVPVASYVPAPVPLHWQKAVKEGIDGDVAMGAREPILKN